MRTLLAMALLFGPGSRENGVRYDTIVVSAEYEIKITDMPIIPKFLSGLFGGIIQSVGVIPDSIGFSDTTFQTEKDDPFRMQAKDAEDDEWIHVVSDTSEISFVKPPFSEKDTLSPEGIKFISRLRQFFRNPDRDSLVASFPFKRGILKVLVFHDTSAKSDAAYREYNPSLFKFRSTDGRKKPYLDCDIWVGSSEGAVIYPKIDATIHSRSVGLVVSIKRLEVVKK